MVLEIERFSVKIGVGTALSIQTKKQAVSIPFLADWTIHYAPTGWFLLETNGIILLYSDGFGVSGQIASIFKPFSFGLIFGVGLGYGFLSVWELNPRSGTFQISLMTGYRF